MELNPLCKINNAQKIIVALHNFSSRLAHFSLAFPHEIFVFPPLFLFFPHVPHKKDGFYAAKAPVRLQSPPKKSDDFLGTPTKTPLALKSEGRKLLNYII